MHELALAQQIIETCEQVARQNNARAVLEVRMLVGALTCVDEQTLAFAFEVAARETLIEGARLVIKPTPLIVHCTSCGFEGEVEVDRLGCPSCEASVDVVSGRELQLESIEVEDDTDA